MVRSTTEVAYCQLDTTESGYDGTDDTVNTTLLPDTTDLRNEDEVTLLQSAIAVVTPKEGGTTTMQAPRRSPTRRSPSATALRVRFENSASGTGSDSDDGTPVLPPVSETVL